MKTNIKGDMADGMIDGTFCQYCGEYLGESCGYPISCSDCQINQNK